MAPTTPMTDVIYEMSSKKLGMTTVQEDGRLRGVISDGDLRRLLEREGGAALTRTAGEAMNPDPKTIAAREFAARALASSKSARSLRLSWSTAKPRRRCGPLARFVGRGADLV